MYVGDIFTLRLRLNFPSSTSPILATFFITSDSFLSSVPWNVEVTCSLRDLGVSATMCTDARFSYFDSSASGFFKGVGFNDLTLIDTTIENRFGLTYTTTKNITMMVRNTLINKLY